MQSQSVAQAKADEGDGEFATLGDLDTQAGGSLEQKIERFRHNNNVNGHLHQNSSVCK